MQMVRCDRSNEDSCPGLVQQPIFLKELSETQVLPKSLASRNLENLWSFSMFSRLDNGEPSYSR